MKISEMITDRYKLRIPPTVYYELLADVQEVEENQESTTKNDLGVDCVSRQAVIDVLAIGEEFLRRVLDEVDVIGHEREKYEWGLGLVESYISDMEELPSVTPQLTSGLEKNSKKLEKDLGESDCISRADAIRVASGYCHPSNVAKELAKLPPATPQEPKSEWQQDHETLKAYSDGAREVLDKIRFDLYKLYNDRPSDYNHSQRTELFCEVIKILDKYTAESAHDVVQQIVKNNGVVDL